DGNPRRGAGAHRRRRGDSENPAQTARLTHRRSTDRKLQRARSDTELATVTRVQPVRPAAWKSTGRKWARRLRCRSADAWHQTCSPMHQRSNFHSRAAETESGGSNVSVVDEEAPHAREP